MDLSIELLRSFVAIVDSGSFTRAAARVHRTQSAVSLQVRRLEQAVGSELFVREHRRVRLSEAGERLLPHARRMLALNDAAVHAMREVEPAGEVRLGCAQDFAERELSRLLEQVNAAHGGLHLRVKVDSTAAVIDACSRGELDLGLVLQPPGGAGRVIAPAPLVWLAASNWEPPAGPLPLVLFEAPCAFRDAALGALDEAGIAWEVVFTTPSLAGALAAVRAGVGVTVRTGRAAADAVVVHGRLPALPPLELALLRGADSASSAVSRLADLLEQVVRDSGPG